MVRERREILDTAPNGIVISIAPYARRSLSWLRVAMGDFAAVYIWIDEDAVPAVWDARLEAAFPEALFFEAHEAWLARQGPSFIGSETKDRWPVPPTPDNKRP